MEPITTVAVTSGLITLAAEIAKGSASEFGKDAWGKLKGVFGWNADPTPEKLTQETIRLEQEPELAEAVTKILQGAGYLKAQNVVGSVKAHNVSVAGVHQGNVTFNG